MRTNRTTLPPEVLLEEYRKILAEDPRVQALPLVVSGSSMSPFLIHGRDTVWLSRLQRSVRRGDILLYQRANGAYVLHRVWKVCPDSYTMVGDAQQELEPGIRDHQIIAVVTAVERKGRKLTPGSFWWAFFEKIWIRVVPLRQPLHRLYSIAHRDRRN
ncbi:MAG: S24/S26 family peptidase [Oscillospiraceae bacterium]|nr:S24/S26 family peptidase [Oscillospiraceae bacterium]